jgi:hypothetical protein
MALKWSKNMGSAKKSKRDAVSLPVLWLVDGIVVVDAGLLLDDLRLCAAAGHGAAEEDVDEQHDAEEHTERDAEVGQPVGVRGSCRGGIKLVVILLFLQYTVEVK